MYKLIRLTKEQIEICIEALNAYCSDDNLSSKKEIISEVVRKKFKEKLKELE